MIDPGADAPQVLATAQQLGATVRAVWLTHAHFDHIGGVAGIVSQASVPVALHSDDLPLYRELGGARLWGIPIDPPPAPTIALENYCSPNAPATLSLGANKFQVFHVPGHTAGHVAFYQPQAGVLFGGDVLFNNSIGRTDLPGGDYDLLMASIRQNFLALPDATVVYSGHGLQTTIGTERQFNPFL